MGPQVLTPNAGGVYCARLDRVRGPLCEQVRTIDISHLSEDLYARVAPSILDKIQQIVANLIGVYA